MCFWFKTAFQAIIFIKNGLQWQPLIGCFETFPLKFVSKIVLSLCLGFSFLTAFAEPSNLGLLKQDVMRYHDSGAYDKELALVISKADRYISKQVKENNQCAIKKHLALVLDIDETSLSNYNHMAKLHFGGDEKAIDQIILAADAPAIKPTLELYRNALKQGVTVFFITGRHKAFRAATEANLVKAGYKNWSAIYFKPDNYKSRSNIAFKEKTRNLISKKGYLILASIGDQYCDLLGGHAKKVYKLPNPFYYLP